MDASRPRSSKRGRRAGSAATELALVLPLVLMLIGGTVDLGRSIHAQIVISNAVRVGAEYGGTHRVSTATLDDWKTRIKTAVVDGSAGISGFDPARMTVTVNVVDDADDHQIITVAASYPLNQRLFFASSNHSVTLRDSVTWRQFR